MASLRALEGLANTVANAFISRGNDLAGYWALGVLYSEAQADGENMVVIDLLSSSDHGRKAARAVQSAFKARLSAYADDHKLRLSACRVVLSFGLRDELGRRRWLGSETPSAWRCRCKTVAADAPWQQDPADADLTIPSSRPGAHARPHVHEQENDDEIGSGNLHSLQSFESNAEL